MPEISKTKVAIIGAGNVGASIAFAMALQQSASEIVLIDEKRRRLLERLWILTMGSAF